MAKKSKPARARTPKPRGVKAGRGKAKKAVREAVRSARERHRQPAAAALPGMEQVRDTTLDRLCRRIGDNGAAMNELRQNVEADKQAALDHMLANKTKQYHHHGVELIVRGGNAKLSVRAYKEAAATVKDADEGADAGGDEGGDEGGE